MTQWKFLTLLTVVVALLWETRYAYSLAYLGLVLFFLLRALQTRAAAKLAVRRDVAERYLFPDDEVQLSLEIANSSTWPLAWISLDTHVPRDLSLGPLGQRPVFSLAPRSSHRVRYAIKGRERGVYRLGPIDLFVGDFLGLQTRKLRVEDYATVVVYPQVYSLTDLTLPSRIAFGNLKSIQPINPDPSRLGGVRPYQQGDPLRTIHWAATARTQSIQVKQFEHRVSANCLVCLGFYQGDYEVASFFVDTEFAVSVAASLASQLIQLGESCGLCTNAHLTEYWPNEGEINVGEGFLNVPPRQGSAHLAQILTVLAGVKPQPNVDFATLLAECGQNLAPGTILLWVVPQDTPELVAKAWRFVKRGYQVQIYVVQRALHRALLQQPRSASLQLFEVSSKGVFSA